LAKTRTATPDSRSAINGRVASNLVYRDIFIACAANTAADTERTFHPVQVANLMETYVPVRAARLIQSMRCSNPTST